VPGTFNEIISEQRTIKKSTGTSLKHTPKSCFVLTTCNVIWFYSTHAEVLDIYTLNMILMLHIYNICHLPDRLLF